MMYPTLCISCESMLHARSKFCFSFELRRRRVKMDNLSQKIDDLSKKIDNLSQKIGDPSQKENARSGFGWNVNQYLNQYIGLADTKESAVVAGGLECGGHVLS